MSETLSSTDPVINVIEQDIPGRTRAVERLASSGNADRLDTAALDAVSVRRRHEFDAARARLRDHAIRDDVEAERTSVPRPAAGAPSRSAVPTRAPLDQAPERVRKRYLRAGNQYFLKDAPYQLAFEDLGPYLVTEHNRPDVVESMVDMASEKSWRRIRVSGHEAFRSEVWLQGTLLGIEVSGYEPKAADLARLADVRQARLNNRIEADASLPPAGASMDPPEHINPVPISLFAAEPHGVTVDAASVASQSSASSARPHQPERQAAAGDEPDAPKRYVGELREHGGAPYQHNPARSDSYYVVFRDATGADHVVWGVDLERAVRESGAEPGQHVMLENLGRRFVTVKVPILDDRGMVVAEEERDVYRNTWQVEVEMRERTAAESPAPNRRVSESGAVRADGAAHEDRQASRRTTVSDEDKVLHLAVLVGAMREQGFSARSIARVQQRAEAMLEVFGREGIPVPRPKVFDPEAPSERDRRARPATARAPVREIERTPADPSPAR
ncbi:DNA primase [Burkholderia arboris]|uniref:DNA primase n=1 Tax=Burkholderia arboris TaxID=488730 RepID=A0ABZ3DWB4_9BURK